MKVFFNASLRGKDLYGEHYEAIRNSIKNSPHELVTYPVDMSSPEKVARETEEESEAYYRKLIEWINQCDAAVFEVSYPSVGIGFEVALALTKGKQVIALHVAGKRPFLLESIKSDKIQVVGYSLENLDGRLSETLEYAKGGLDSRFTMILSSDISGFLDELYETTGISRSDYIRDLIKRDMRVRKK